MTLTCPACGGTEFILGGTVLLEMVLNKPDNEICKSCGFAGEPMMMSDAAREAVARRHQLAVQATALPEGYDQAQHDRDVDALFGPRRTPC